MKSNTTITLDTEVLAEARKRSLNISSFCNKAIRGWLDMPECKKEADRAFLEKEIIVLKAAMAETEKKIEEKKKKTVSISV